MNRIRAMIDVCRRLFGVAGRHNRALGEVKDWANTISQFLQKYGLDEDNGMEKLLENSGDVKFELTAIVYKGRPLVSRAGRIKNKRVPSMLAGIVDSAEGIRRYLINPALQKERLSQGIINFRSSFEELQRTLAEIEYL